VRLRRPAVAAALAGAVLATGMLAGASGAAAPHGKAPHLKHVFTIVLENENADTTFGKGSDAPYLAKTLRRRGEFLPNYYATGHESLDNYISMISGQAPNVQTQADCQLYTDFIGLPTGAGQYLGTGCVYPPGAETVVNQLEDSGYRWRAYAQDMNADAPKGKEDPCRHPTLNAQDHTQSAHKGDQYASRHVPFLYFHSIIDSGACAKHVVDLTHLNADLRHAGRTPNYVFITPNLCSDGHDSPCVNGKPGGLKSANAFLKRRVPRILRSHAYRHRGLLMIIFDEAEGGPGGNADSSACCGEQPGPNLIPPITPGALTPGPGGGRTGAVFLSPCLKAGTVNRTPYNHYSMLRSVEDNFHLTHLGFAGQQGLQPFGRRTLNRRGCGARH
jgi:phosphatidylinositol-3-phosphatase